MDSGRERGTGVSDCRKVRDSTARWILRTKKQEDRVELWGDGVVKGMARELHRGHN